MRNHITYLLFMLLCLSYQARICTTSIAIFDDHIDAQTPKNNAILSEFQKTVCARAEHIFVTPYVWDAFIGSLNKKKQSEFLQKWHIFDTKIGLLYLKHIHASDHTGIKHHIFTPLSQPFKKLKQTYKRWAQSFDGLFDLHQWQTYHQTHQERSFVYMNGHGSPRGCHYSCEFACGITTEEFARLLKLFHVDLHIDLLGVQSCYWTSKRIFEVMKKKYGYTQLSFSIITPLRPEKPLWLAGFCQQCTCNQSNDYCFYEGIRRMVTGYKGKITSTMKAIAKNIDTIKLRNNKHQGINMIIAGCNRPEQI